MSKGGGTRTSVRTTMAGITGHQSMPYILPGLLCGLAMPVALIAHWQWGNDPIMTAVMGAMALAMTLGTRTAWSRRSEHTRDTATLFAGLVLGWIVVATATDPWSSGARSAWLLGGAGLWIYWDIRYAAMSSPHEHDTASGGTGVLGKVMDSIKRIRVGKVDPAAKRVEMKVDLHPGQGTSEDVQAARGRIASQLSVGKEEVTVSRIPGRADQARIVVQVAEKGPSVPVAWGGFSALGKSVADAPLVPGMRSDGRPTEVWLCGDDDKGRQLSHMLFTGMSGAGKTETAKIVILEARSRIDVVPIVADPDKPDQSFGDIADCLGIFAKLEDAAQLMRNIPGGIKYRQNLMGSLRRSDGGTGYSQWVPECWTLHGIPLVLVNLEEATSVLEDDSGEMDKNVRAARSVGFIILLSLQVATWSNIDRKTRGQFGQAFAHGVKEWQDAKFGLSAHTLEAGADPSKWANTRAGSYYAELAGTPQDEWAVDARAFKLSYEQKRAAVEESRPYWAQLDPGTYEALSRGISTLHAVPDEDGDAEDEEGGAISGTVINEDGEEIDITAPLQPAALDLVFPREDKGMTREHALGVLNARIDQIEASGSASLTFDDLRDLPDLVGKSGSWVYGELVKLEESGRLLKHGGKPPWFIQKKAA